jgi:pimeloyl-ACP methyl ester carboxylesterase
VLNGRKRWPGNAVWCDLIVVFARDVGDGRVKAFVVGKDDPGFHAAKIDGKMALRTVQNADILLEDVRVSEDRRLPGCASFADVAPDGGKLRMPVLFVHASWDPTCSTLGTAALAEPMRAACSDLTEAVVDSGHYVSLENPEGLESSLGGWLAELD